MSAHPLNLLIRFLLEIMALASVGLWGWKQSDGWLQWLLAIGIPLVLAALWGTFAVVDDPSRSGAAPVVTPGIIRLMLELMIFAFSIWCLYDLDLSKASLSLMILVIVHYIISYDRVMWLIWQ